MQQTLGLTLEARHQHFAEGDLSNEFKHFFLPFKFQLQSGHPSPKHATDKMGNPTAQVSDKPS
jgi:hypothetical protein